MTVPLLVMVKHNKVHVVYSMERLGILPEKERMVFSMNEKDEQRLLHEICRNASMGVESIDAVLKDVYDEELAYELHREASKMRQFARKASERLKKDGSQPADEKPLVKKMLRTSIHMKTAMKGETKDVAEMLEKGNEKGMEQLKNSIHKYKKAGIFATELAKEMIAFEEDNIKKMQSFKEHQ